MMISSRQPLRLPYASINSGGLQGQVCPQYCYATAMQNQGHYRGAESGGAGRTVGCCPLLMARVMARVMVLCLRRRAAIRAGYARKWANKVGPSLIGKYRSEIEKRLAAQKQELASMVLKSIGVPVGREM